MAKLNFRWIPLLAVGLAFTGAAGCAMPLSAPWESNGAPSEDGILFYDIALEIDPPQRVFQSRQRITLSAGAVEGRRVSVYLGDELIVDRVSLEDEAGAELEIASWRMAEGYSVEYFWGRAAFSEVVIETEKPVPNDGRIILELEYHLPKELFRDGPAKNLYDLHLDAQGGYAGGLESGAFVMVDGNLSAPFRIRIRHPEGIRCAVPGEEEGGEESGGFITETYRSEFPFDPSFSCAQYQILRTPEEGPGVAVYYPARVQLSPAMLKHAESIMALLRESFGPAPAEILRIVFPEFASGVSGGESNGNVVFLGDFEPFLKFDTDEAAREIFDQLVAHEGYHLWNTWGLTWEGPLSEWWVEGGANFMASWTKEILLGQTAAAENRLDHLRQFDEQAAYLHEGSLFNLGDDWFEDFALVYDYGALVWEQLRQKMGSGSFTAGLREFYERNRGARVGYDGFLSCLQRHTAVDIAEYLRPWTAVNARIDLRINRVSVEPAEGGFAVEVDVEVESDREAELYSALGYKTAPDGDWTLIDLRPLAAGIRRVRFTSAQRPVIIQIDPEYRVPQIHAEDNSWTEGGSQGSE